MSNQPQIEIVSSTQAVAEISNAQVATEILTSTAPKIIEINVAGPQGPAGVAGSSRLSDLTDVNVVEKANGSVLYYDELAEKFVANDVNTLATLTDGGNF